MEILSVRPVIRALEKHPDGRGCVLETYRASWFPGVPPVVQAVQSESRPRVQRAMHAHKIQWDIWHFVAGAAFVQLYDHRDGWYDCMTLRGGATIAIPPGVSHGFYTAEGCTLIYLLTREYDGSDEYEWNAADPTWPGAKHWPDRSPNLSVRDATSQSLQEFIERW